MTLMVSNRRTILTPAWNKNDLWRRARAVPSLDLRFAESKSLVDATTGSNLVAFTRASAGTFTNSARLIETAVTNLLLQSEDFSTTWNFTNYTITTGHAAPDGSLNAWKIIKDDVLTTGGISQNVTPVIGQTVYMYSIYAKAGELTKVGIREGVGTGAYSTFDLSSGSLISSGNGASGATITPAGDGWYRISFARNTNTDQTGYGCRVYALPDAYTSGSPTLTWINDNISGIYIWGAQLEQSSAVGEYIPTTSVINSAPRFDHDPVTGESLGLLVEEQRTNLCLYSEILNEAATSFWSERDAYQTFLDASAASPAGNLGVWYLTGDSGVGYDNTFRTSAISVNASTTYTFSVYAKPKNGASGFTLRLIEIGGTSSSSAKQLTSDWARYSITFTTSASATQIVALIGLDSSADEVYLWGAQLEAGSFATSYIKNVDTVLGTTRAADVASISGSNFGVFRTNLLTYSEEFDQAAWSASDASVSANQTIAPDGNTTADKLVCGTGTPIFQGIQQSITATASATRFSVYVKAAEIDQVELRSFNPTDLAIFELSTQQVLSQSGSPAPTITDAGNGWYRCSITSSSSAATSFRISLISGGNRTFTPISGAGLYIWGAQLEVGSAATPYVKSDVNWTSRSSNATYYDASGTLRKSSYNLLTYSEDFTQWILQNITGSGSLGTQSVTTPDGSSTSYTITTGATSGTGDGVSSNGSVSDSQTITGSIYLKVGTAVGQHRLRLRFAGGTVADGDVFYDLASGVVVSEDVGRTGTITNAGNGWYRLTITGTNNATGNTSAQLFAYAYDTTAGTYYLWGAQLETGTYAGDYAKTTTVPASTPRTAAYLPDGNGNFVSAGPLLLEKEATNLLLQSEDFSTTWTLGGVLAFGSGSTADATTAPNGATTADLIVENTASSPHSVTQSYIFTAGTYTFSVFVKAAGRTFARLLLFDGTTTFSSFFNLTTGAPASVGAGVAASMAPYPNGWYRCAITVTAAAGSGNASMRMSTGSTPGDDNYSGDGTSGIYLWGAQLEVGSSPTSYISTQNAQATRTADVSTSAATTVFESDWYRQDEGTVFAEASMPFVASGARGPVHINDSAGVNLDRIMIRNGGSGNLDHRITINDVSQTNLESGNTLVANAFFKSAFALAVNNFASAFNGGNLLTDTSGSLPVVNQIFIGDGASNANQRACTVRRLTYWPQRLSNSTLANITQ